MLMKLSLVDFVIAIEPKYFWCGRPIPTTSGERYCRGVLLMSLDGQGDDEQDTPANLLIMLYELIAVVSDSDVYIYCI